MQLINKSIYSLTLGMIFLVMMSVPAFSAVESVPATKEAAKAEVSKPAHSIVVTYFYTSVRCPTCHKIEELSSQAVKSHFENELKSGKVVWRTINVDEPENAHYNKDYQLYTKSLIVSDVKDGKEVRWKNLEKIWVFVRDEAQFDQYVNAEIAGWLKE